MPFSAVEAAALGFAGGLAVGWLFMRLGGRRSRRPPSLPRTPPARRPEAPRGAPAPPAVETADNPPATGMRASMAQAEREVAAAWLQFLRREVADTVNALNSRFTVLKTLVSGFPPDGLEASQREALERIDVELERAAAATATLYQQVSSASPDPARPSVSEIRPHHVAAATILVVEADDTTRDVIGQLFRSAGHTVVPARDGVEAFAVLRERTVECVISDTRASRLSGQGLYEQVEEWLPHVARRFVFISGDTQQPEVREFLERSGRPVVPKPFDVDLLVEAVNEVLERVEREVRDGQRPRPAGAPGGS